MVEERYHNGDPSESKLYMYYAAAVGNVESLRWYSRIVPESLPTAIRAAATTNQPHILTWLNQHGVYEVEMGLMTAAQYGHIDLIDRFILQGAHDMESALYAAAENGQIPAAEYLIKLGARDLHNALRYAIMSGDREMAEWLIERGAKAGPLEYGLSQLKIHPAILLKS